MKFNIPTNTLNIGSIDLTFHTEQEAAPVGTLSPDQWVALLALLQPLVPPPLGSKQV
jgi:hypothetical protein